MRPTLTPVEVVDLVTVWLAAATLAAVLAVLLLVCALG